MSDPRGKQLEKIFDKIFSKSQKKSQNPKKNPEIPKKVPKSQKFSRKSPKKNPKIPGKIPKSQKKSQNPEKNLKIPKKVSKSLTKFLKLFTPRIILPVIPEVGKTSWGNRESSVSDVLKLASYILLLTYQTHWRWDLVTFFFFVIQITIPSDTSY